MNEEKILDPKHGLKAEETTDHRTPTEIAEEAARAVPDRLLEYLRKETGNPELEYASPPKRMKNGNASYLIYGFELSSVREKLAGPLVLRLFIGTYEEAIQNQREAALMDAAGKLGCKVPRIRLAESGKEDLGGPFMIMDQVPGKVISRWFNISVLIGLVASLFFWHVWPLLAGYLLGSLVVGVVMGIQQRKLHSLKIEDLKSILKEHGLKVEDVDAHHNKQIFLGFIDEVNLESFRPGMRWLEENLPAIKGPGLCHSDFHANNVLGTWTKVTGIIDWEGACISDPELDVAYRQCSVILESGWIGRLILLPQHLVYRVIQGRLDREYLRYYLAQRAFNRACGGSWYLAQNSTDGEGGLSGTVQASIRGKIKRYTRYFQKIMGTDLTSPEKISL